MFGMAFPAGRGNQVGGFTGGYEAGYGQTSLFFANKHVSQYNNPEPGKNAETIKPSVTVNVLDE